MSRTPKSSDLLLLTPRLKPLLLKDQPDKGFEMVGLGIRLPGLPSSDSFACNAQQGRQPLLSQPDAGAQGQHPLTEVIIAFSVQGQRHKQTPFTRLREGTDMGREMGHGGY